VINSGDEETQKYISVFEDWYKKSPQQPRIDDFSSMENLYLTQHARESMSKCFLVHSRCSDIYLQALSVIY